MQSLKQAHMLLAFGLELAMLLGFAVAGYVSTPITWLRLVLMVGLPTLAILLWAVWAAPKAGKRRLKMPQLLIFKLAIYAVATAAWWAAGQSFIAAIFGALVVVSLAAGLAFKAV